MNDYFVTISKPSTPRGSAQGNYAMFLSKKLRSEMDSVSIRQLPTGDIIIKEAGMDDRKARSCKSVTSIRSETELRIGRHMATKHGDRFVIKCM